MLFVTIFVEQALNEIIVDNGTQDTLGSTTLGTLPPDVYTDPTLPPDFTGVTIPPEDITIPTAPEDFLQHEQIVNIMLVGQDRRPYQNYRTLSDSMILCTFNLRDNTLTMTSFMRDMYVQIPGVGGNKLNAAYLHGGMPLLQETMLLNFGVSVDAFVEVDFSGFTKVVDTLGGVEITLTQREADYMNTFYWGMGIDNSNWNLSEGTQILNGEQALSYSRIRMVPTLTGANNDFGRTERQRRVLSQVLSECKRMDFATAYALVKELIPIVKTDISRNEIFNYFLTLFPMLTSTQITNQRIPIDGSYEYAWVGSLDVVLPDLEKNRQFLYDTLMPD
jgi:LCP family protein required for cell wall assembly